VGLDYNLGGSGRRLTLAQRQKLNLARALLRKSDYYIFNRPLSGLDPGQQEQVLIRSLEFLREQADDPAVVWVLSSRNFAKYFDRLVLFRDRTILEEEETTKTFAANPDTNRNVVGFS
jgi:putative ABC transport system ATP-binding protein